MKISANPLLGHLHPDFCAIMDDVKAGIKHLFQTENELTIALCASGHAAMEATLVNVLEAGEKVAIARNGIWGDRASDIASRAGIQVEMMNPMLRMKMNQMKTGKENLLKILEKYFSNCEIKIIILFLSLFFLCSKK